MLAPQCYALTYVLSSKDLLLLIIDKEIGGTEQLMAAWLDRQSTGARAHSGCGPGRMVRLVPKYTYHSLTERCSSSLWSTFGLQVVEKFL